MSRNPSSLVGQEFAELARIQGRNALTSGEFHFEKRRGFRCGMPTSKVLRSGYTLIEMLIVVAIVGILASVVVPSLSSTSGAVTLEAMARSLAADLRGARQAAVQYNASYSVTLDLANNSYQAKPASGSAPGMVNVLAPTGAGTTIDLDTYGAAGKNQSHVVLGGAALKTSKASVVDITFTSSGGTGPARTQDTVIWLSENTQSNRRSILITVSWITGAVSVGDVQSYPTNLTKPNF
jgi:prepilin-type N-terminal cleavage/methylation domain-containing protein